MAGRQTPIGTAGRVNAAILAARLLAVREGAPPLEEVAPADRPQDVARAYAIADRIVAALEPRYGPVVGYKVGATSVQGQRMLGLTEPFYGRVLRQWLVSDGGILKSCGSPSSVEPEVGFLIGANLPPRREEYSGTEVASAIGRIIPLLEINCPAFARPFEMGGLCLIADNGVTKGFVLGGPGSSSSAAGLSDEKVTLSRNGETCAVGSAEVVLGDPFNAVVWLVNTLRAQGRGLRAGDVIASGAMTPHVPLAAGDIILANYSTLGHVRLEIGDP